MKAASIRAILLKASLLVFLWLVGGGVGGLIAIWGEGAARQNERVGPGLWIGSSVALGLGFAGMFLRKPKRR